MTASINARTAELFDKGLQPERTALAWRRTGLALAVGALISFRVLPATLGSWALLPAAAGLVAAVLILWGAHRRSRSTFARLLSGTEEESRLPGGLLLLAMTLTCVAGGIAALIVVLTRGAS